MAYDPTSQDPTKNIFAYGGNSVDAASGVATPVSGTINGYTLNPQAQIPYTTPNPVPVPVVPPPVDPLATPPLTPTAPQQQATDMISRIQALNTQYTGQSSYRTQQEAVTGLPDLQKTQTDLTAQIRELGRQSADLQNIAANIPSQMQSLAAGRGVTVGGLAPLTSAQLRDNQNQQRALASSALAISAALDAVNGNLVTAQQKVDAAVATKYDPIKEQIDAATKNLDLLLKSPEYTLAEKNQAQAQLDIQAQKQRDLEKKQADSKTILSWAAAALTNGATPLQAQAISKIGTSDNPDLQTAFALYAPFAKDPQATQKAILELQAMRDEHNLSLANQAKVYTDIAKIKADNQVLSIKDAQALGVPYGTTKAQAIALGKTPGVTSEASALKDNARISAQALLDKFNAGTGRSAVGGDLLNRLGPVGDFLGMGTGRADFIVQLNNLKSLLSLDNVKLLKGQGQVSDAERRLLEQASAKLDRTQSEPEFKSALQDVIRALSGSSNDDVQVVNGVTYKKAADGLYYPTK